MPKRSNEVMAIEELAQRISAQVVTQLGGTWHCQWCWARLQQWAA